MIGTMVEHPQYGQGQVVAVHRNGAEWTVKFWNGWRFRRPRTEFVGEQTDKVAPAGLPPYEIFPPTRTQFEARQLVEALRVGVAPAQHVRELTVGLVNERKSIVEGLNQSHQLGGAVRTVIGDYGFGKSHLVELTAQEALSRNFLVAITSLDLQELPAYKGYEIYVNLISHIRYPDRDEQGPGPLFELAAGNSRAREQLQKMAPAGIDPLVLTLNGVVNSSSARQRAVWYDWLQGGRRHPTMSQFVPRGFKFPVIYKIGHNGRQMSYLLTGLSTVARLANYSGLCLLIDEAESYSLLTPLQRQKANLFFQTMIYGALGNQQSRINGEALPQHHWQHYPAGYGNGQSLFFLFTMTRSDNPMPIEAWLDESHRLELNPHHTPQEIRVFIQQAENYHAQAYGYELDERHGQVRRAAAEHLAEGMRSGRVSIRGLVRLVIELLDLLYLYPADDVAQLLEELRQQMRGQTTTP